MSTDSAQKSDESNSSQTVPANWAHNYQAFLLRIWREAEDAPWRATLTQVHTKESYSFGTAQALLLYLHEQMTGTG